MDPELAPVAAPLQFVGHLNRLGNLPHDRRLPERTDLPSVRRCQAVVLSVEARARSHEVGLAALDVDRTVTAFLISCLARTSGGARRGIGKRREWDGGGGSERYEDEKGHRWLLGAL